MTPEVLVGLLAEPTRMRVFAAIVLGATTPAEVGERTNLTVREVAEETGVRGRILGEVGSIHYWFSRHGTRYSKDVLYYLMIAQSGDVALHDHEYAEARWFTLGEASRMLTYPNEVALLGEADPAIRRYLSDMSEQARDGSSGS